jgi:hypothetical protein
LKTYVTVAAEVIADQAAEHLRIIRRLNDIAYTFLGGAEGDQVEAEKSFETCLDVLFESGALVMKYRIVLSKIRKGL